MQPDRTDQLVASLDRRILIMDGAMGTMIQTYRLDGRAIAGRALPATTTTSKEITISWR